MLQVWKESKSGKTHKIEDRQALKHPEMIDRLKREGFILSNPPKQKKKVAKKKKASKK